MGVKKKVGNDWELWYGTYAVYLELLKLFFIKKKKKNHFLMCSNAPSEESIQSIQLVNKSVHV